MTTIAEKKAALAALSNTPAEPTTFSAETVAEWLGAVPSTVITASQDAAVKAASLWDTFSTSFKYAEAVRKGQIK